MASFVDNSLTNAGQALLEYIGTGWVFTPTKIVLGSGYLPVGTTSETITDVVAPEKTLSINKKARGGNGTVVIGGAYSNQDVTTGFYFRELALYAKAVSADGESEQPEVLYSYGNAGDSADFMPAYSTGEAVERQIDLVTYIGNDAQIDLTIESGLYIPTSEKGQPNGVATLDEDGKVPEEQLPEMDYIPYSEKGENNGVAPLGTDGKVPREYLHGTGFIEMQTSLPIGDREDETLYGLILADFST